MRFAATLFSLLLLAGCEETKTPDPLVAGKVHVASTSGNNWTEWHATKRFTVAYQGTFQAGYRDNRRDILVITDTTTGVEYLAITGCGTTELHSVTRNHGKTSTTVQMEE